MESLLLVYLGLAIACTVISCVGHLLDSDGMQAVGVGLGFLGGLVLAAYFIQDGMAGVAGYAYYVNGVRVSSGGMAVTYALGALILGSALPVAMGILLSGIPVAVGAVRETFREAREGRPLSVLGKILAVVFLVLGLADLATNFRVMHNGPDPVPSRFIGPVAFLLLGGWLLRQWMRK